MLFAVFIIYINMFKDESTRMLTSKKFDTKEFIICKYVYYIIINNDYYH